MKKNYLLLCLSIFLSVFSQAQKVTISGYVSDVATGEKLINANIFETENLSGTISNEYGFYSVTLPAGKKQIQYSFVGYEKQNIEIDLHKDTVINVALKLMGEIDEITVLGNRSKIESSQMSMVEIPGSKLQKLPVLFGEPDVLKVIQLGSIRFSTILFPVQRPPKYKTAY